MDLSFLHVSKALMRQTDLNTAVMLSAIQEICYTGETGEKDTDGWFLLPIRDVQNKTSLTAYQQRNAIDKLVAMGFIEISFDGMPYGRHIRFKKEA